MTRRKYEITIHTSLNKGLREPPKTGVQYPRIPQKSVGDKVIVYTKKVVICAERNKKIALEDIVEYKQNTIYMQMYKALLYLFLKRGKRVMIRSIEMKCGNTVSSLNIDKSRQPLANDFRVQYAVLADVLDVLWEESVKGQSLRSATSHFLVALSTKDRYKRFERLWRAFEQIAMWHKYHATMPRKPTEFCALLEMRSFICTKPMMLGKTFDYVSTLVAPQIEKLHWGKFIQNKFSQNNVNDLYDEFVARNEDERLVGVYNKALILFKREIGNSGRKGNFDATISNYSQNHVRNDAHILSVLVCKYCYFMRNKMFHGELGDFSFCFTNHTEDDDITDFLNDLLEKFVNELICGYNKL